MTHITWASAHSEELKTRHRLERLEGHSASLSPGTSKQHLGGAIRSTQSDDPNKANIRKIMANMMNMFPSSWKILYPMYSEHLVTILQNLTNWSEEMGLMIYHVQPACGA